jgi:hypothetical protein
VVLGYYSVFVELLMQLLVDEPPPSSTASSRIATQLMPWQVQAGDGDAIEIAHIDLTKPGHHRLLLPPL